jgi:hypothetical protein
MTTTPWQCSGKTVLSLFDYTDDDIFNDQEHRAWMAQAKTPRPRYNPWERAG